jgi:hypothetical protein
MEKPVTWKLLREKLLCGANDPGGVRLCVYESDAQSYDRKLWIVEPVTPAAYPPA